MFTEMVQGLIKSSAKYFFDIDPCVTEHITQRIGHYGFQVVSSIQELPAAAGTALRHGLQVISHPIIKELPKLFS